ncbi:MAG: alanine--tRNA ligase [Chloroflexota bacterium]
MTPHELREAFLRFWEERGHKRIPGAPIIPPGDPTLLFTSAGMVQFKPYFTGQADPPAPRMTSVQKCFRTTDIETVGDTSHLTFFEMLGNFSIGDYFKAEVIPWAQEYLTTVLGLPQERLWPAVFEDDDEAFDLWRAQGYPAARIMRYGEDDNYWFSGDVGPCGPDSEIHYDFGEQFGCGPDCHPSHGHARFVEIWNLVFMTYSCDGEKREPLPKKNIDTGSGFEREMLAVLHNDPKWDKSKLPSVYDTEIFQPMIRRIEQLSNKKYGSDEATDRAMRIVAEHSRAVTFLIGDERTPVVPSNEERGYVCRRILRRAVYFGRRHLGIEEPFMADLANTVVDAMKDSYPELERQRKFINEIIGPEEQRFDQTLHRGLERLEEIITVARNSSEEIGVISGADAFTLHDTYGFPIDLTRDIAEQYELNVDVEGFEREMAQQRDRARASSGGAEHVAADTLYASLTDTPTRFTGYDELETTSRVVALLSDGAAVDKANQGDKIEIFLAATPLYPEGGGQVGDRGEIVAPNGRIVVEDTQRVAGKLIMHRGRVAKGSIAVGEEVTARVDAVHRGHTRRNHTATHLLHAALRQVVGPHVRQAGSLVAPDHLRFDFTHSEAVTAEQLAEVESLVNEKVRQDVPVHSRETSFDDAMQEGVLAFFGDKYGERVRVVEVNTIIPRFSAELCGGTHCEHTGEIGAIIITGESSIGSGMRRIEALTGAGAEQHIREQKQIIADAANKLGAQPSIFLQKLDSLLKENATLRRNVEKLERSLATGGQSSDLTDRVQDVDGVRLLVARIDAPSVDVLRFTGDSIRKSMPDVAAVLGAVVDDRPMFIALVPKPLVERGLHAGNLLKRVATVAGGNAGGRPDTAQGGGKDVSKLDEALAIVPDAVREMLGAK